MEEKPDLKHFKTQVDSMLSALAQMNSSDKSIAFSLLKNCISSAQDHSSESLPTLPGENEQPASEENILYSLQNSAIPEESNDYGPEFVKVETLANEELAPIETFPENGIHTIDFSTDETKKFSCSDCSLNFSSIDELSNHFETHPKNPAACRKCTKEFTNEYLFKLHFDHDECKKYRKPVKDSLMKTCSYCQKKFFNAQHYDRHISGHKRNNCSLCSALFTNRKKLETHMLEIHNSKLEKNFFECKFCFKKLSQKRSILKHYKLHHSKQCSVCTLCGKFFDSANELESHLLEHESKKWTCEPCKQTFIRHQQYLKHLSEHDKYFCMTCDVGFSSRSKITSHCKLGHAVRGLDDIHKCNTCNKILESRGKLIKHLRTHEEKDSFVCKTCKLSFNKASAYKQHLSSSWHTNKTTSISENSSHECHLCFKSFPNKNQLLIHSQEIHGVSQNVTKCPFCNYKTKTSANMRRHIDQHTQPRKYVCDQCGSSFFTYSCLKEHIICRHSTERNFSCEKCGQSFKLNSGLKRHMATHSEERTKKCHCGQAYKLSTNLKRHQLIAHGRVDSPSGFQRLIKNDYGDYIPVESRKQVKNVEVVDKTFHLQNADVKTVLQPPDNSVPLNDCGLMQSVQVIYQNLDFPPTNDNKQSFLFTPTMDLPHLQIVDNMLKPQDIFDPTAQNFQITDTDSYLTSDVTLNPSIQVSQMGNLDLASHSNQLASDVPVSSSTDNHQNLLNSLSDYIIPHQFPFLNV